MTYPTITAAITATVISEVMTEQLDSEINQKNYISIMTNSENGRKQDTNVQVCTQLRNLRFFVLAKNRRNRKVDDFSRSLAIFCSC